jgi:lipopolysaccharide transport system permease protein
MVAMESPPQIKRMWSKKKATNAPIALIKENYEHRELVLRLIRRDLDSRFRGPLLGYSWAIIEPLLLALVYSFVFGIIVGRSDPLYPAIVMIGVIGWSLFARCMTGTTKTLTSNASLFQFTKIPKSVFAISNMMTNYLLSCISLFALIPFIYLNDLSMGISYLMLPIYLLLLALTGTTLGLLLAPGAVRIPDLVNIVQFLARVGFFLSPVMWTYQMLSGKFGTGRYLVLAHLNPVIVPITKMRDIILNQESNIPNYGIYMFISTVMFFYLAGTMFFHMKANKMVVGL